MSRGLNSQYGLRPHFKYFATTQNPADLITRGLTLKKSNLGLFDHGPSWLHGEIHSWPTKNFDRQSRWVARSSVVLEEECPSIVPLGRFSTFTRLLKITALLFISRQRTREEDCDRKEAIYLLKTLQQQEFA